MKRDVREKKIKEVYATTGAAVVVIGLLYIGITGFFSGVESHGSLSVTSSKQKLAKHI